MNNYSELSKLYYSEGKYRRRVKKKARKSLCV